MNFSAQAPSPIQDQASSDRLVEFPGPARRLTRPIKADPHANRMSLRPIKLCHAKLGPTKLGPARRSGISLFEVLISMLVASIGVIGVLVLIPFAVKVAERGLDQESAITHARNFFSDFEAEGYRNSDRWVDAIEFDPADPTVTIANPLDIGIDFGQVYLIDPIGLARARDMSLNPGLFPMPFPTFVPFPYATDAMDMFPDELQIRRISLRDDTRDRLLPLDPFFEDANSLPLSQARRLFSAPDDLNFDDTPANAIVGPAQHYLQDGANSPVTRQYDGSFSSMMFVLPDPLVPGQWIAYTLVMKNRLFDPNNFIGGTYDPGIAGNNPIRPGQPRVFTVVHPLVVPPLVPFSNTGVIGYGGGDISIFEVINQPPLDDAELRVGDWMMLINGHYDTITPPTNQQIVNLNFYRVIETTPGSTTVPSRVTLQGPDFEFTDDTGPTDPANPTAPDNTKTYAVLIPNVIAVYERTIKPERSSDYN